MFESFCFHFADSTITYKEDVVAFDFKEDVASFDFNCEHWCVEVVQYNTVILGGERNCLERIVRLHRCDGYQKTDSYLFRQFLFLPIAVENYCFSKIPKIPIFQLFCIFL